jgi:predicted anti-sigma-YlaC factor YlaD
MNCSRALKLVSCVLDGAATEHQKRLLDFHLLGCPSCRKAFRMSSDISHLSRDLPDPAPPADLEQAVRTMLASNPSGPRHTRRIRTSLLAVPAVAALIVLAMSISPLSNGRSQRIHETPALAQSSVPAKGGTNRDGSKSTVRTAPLSTYSRQASLISF